MRFRKLFVVVLIAGLTFGGTFTCSSNNDDDDFRVSGSSSSSNALLSPRYAGGEWQGTLHNNE